MDRLVIGKMNDGPTTKRAFRNIPVLADILHVPMFVPVFFKTLFGAFNSGLFIQIDALETFCQNFIREFSESEYKWNMFSPTVHDLAWHSPKIVAFIQSHNITVKDSSEEGAEGDNKTFRYDVFQTFNNVELIPGRIRFSSDTFWQTTSFSGIILIL